jgi:ABC-type Mn2+/Zn2+ transport system permease subunit
MKHNRMNFSRRGLLKSSVLGVSATVLGGPLVLRGSATTTDANSKVSLAVVGCGGQGRSDMSELLSSGANLVAL